jgi:hypothetical protein
MGLLKSIIILLTLLSAAGRPAADNLGTGLAAINQQKIKVEIASTFSQHYQGLSGRASLCADCGLLFNFTDSEQKSFVMRNMNFPLDIIFINQGVVQNIAENLEPEGNDPQHVYRSAGEADQVLEVNGGYCEKYNIRAGDKVYLSND